MTAAVHRDARGKFARKWGEATEPVVVSAGPVEEIQSVWIDGVLRPDVAAAIEAGECTAIERAHAHDWIDDDDLGFGEVPWYVWVLAATTLGLAAYAGARLFG